MSILKKILAVFLTIATIFAFTGCSDTTWAAKTADDSYSVRAGIYLYYLASAYSQAMTTAQSEDSSLDTTDEKAVANVTIEDKNITNWIKDTATQSLTTYLQIQKKFDEMELTLSDDDNAEIKNYVDTMWSNNKAMFETNGISEQSLKDVITSTYKSQAIFDAYYAKGGLEEVPESEIKDYFVSNYARVKWVAINLKDGNGNLLTSDEDKAELKKLADSYLKEAKSGKNFDEIIDEYVEYSSSVSAEAAAETATTSETEAVVTTEAPSGNLYKAEEDDSENDTVSTLDDIDSSVIDKNVSDSKSDEDSSSDLEDIEDNAVTTVADSDTTEETTTTTDPYANEKIIQLGSESTDGSEANYSPSKTVNDAIFAAELNKPFLVEDAEVYYVIVRYDILEREDIWTEDTIETLLNTMKNDDFVAMLQKVMTTDDVVKNEESYKRYDPLKLKLS